MIKELGLKNSIFNKFLAELRDEKIQKDSLRFRRNLERIGEIFAYEISKGFKYEKKEIITPLGIAKTYLSTERPVLATILRAGLPLNQGLLNYFDDSDNAFVSAYRKYDNNEDFHIKLDYVSSPNITGRTLIISDPMLATGGSMVASLKGLLEKGKPKKIHIVTLLATEEGIAMVRKHFTLRQATIWTGKIDKELTAKAYIVPGLGDAGDLSFGVKDD
jgi:uracil phosphoribosyltransferase